MPAAKLGPRVTAYRRTGFPTILDLNPVHAILIEKQMVYAPPVSLVRLIGDSHFPFYKEPFPRSFGVDLVSRQ